MLTKEDMSEENKPQYDGMRFDYLSAFWGNCDPDMPPIPPHIRKIARGMINQSMNERKGTIMVTSTTADNGEDDFKKLWSDNK